MVAKLLSRPEASVVDRVCEILSNTPEGMGLAVELRREISNLVHERNVWMNEAHELVARFVKKQ